MTVKNTPILNKNT